MIRGRTVLFIADHSPPFTGTTYRTAGVGGTAALIVLLAEQCAHRGAAVTVATSGTPAASDGPVSYVPASSIAGRAFDVVVLTKRWSDLALAKARLRLFFMTDVHLNPEAQIPRCIGWAHAAFGGSPFCAASVNAAVEGASVHAIEWPVDVEAYAGAPARRDNTLVYCSVPDRGLYYLKDIFPAVKRAVPDATLIVTSDFSLWGMKGARDAFEKFFKGQTGVEYLGHVDRASLVSAQFGAKVMAYPCTFPESFCLSAAECMAAGTVPVTTNAFALTTTVGGAGVLIDGRPRSWFYRRRFTRAVIGLLTDDARWQAKSGECRTAAERFRASNVLDRLLAHIPPLAPEWPR